MSHILSRIRPPRRLGSNPHAIPKVPQITNRRSLHHHRKPQQLNSLHGHPTLVRINNSLHLNQRPPRRLHLYPKRWKQHVLIFTNNLLPPNILRPRQRRNNHPGSRLLRPLRPISLKRLTPRRPRERAVCPHPPTDPNIQPKRLVAMIDFARYLSDGAASWLRLIVALVFLSPGVPDASQTLVCSSRVPPAMAPSFGLQPSTAGGGCGLLTESELPIRWNAGPVASASSRMLQQLLSAVIRQPP